MSVEILVSSEVANQRLTICESCPEYFFPARICSQCYCVMPIKTRLASANCPLDKWDNNEINNSIENQVSDNCCPPQNSPIVVTPPPNYE